MRRIALTALILLGSTPVVLPVAAHALQDDPAPTELERKQAKAKELLDLNGTRALQERMLDKMLAQFETLGLPAEFSQRFKEKFDLDEILRINVEIYADKLEEDTLDGLLVFYATPVGQAFAAALPEITEAGLEAGMAYGKRIGEEVGREIGGGK
jgi:hypothetical protein